MDQLKPFLFAGLNNREDPQGCLSAISVISGLCRAIGENVFPICDEIVRALNRILEVSIIERFQKNIHAGLGSKNEPESQCAGA